MVPPSFLYSTGFVIFCFELWRSRPSSSMQDMLKNCSATCCPSPSSLLQDLLKICSALWCSRPFSPFQDSLEIRSAQWFTNPSSTLTSHMYTSLKNSPLHGVLILPLLAGFVENSLCIVVYSSFLSSAGFFGNYLYIVV